MIGSHGKELSSMELVYMENFSTENKIPLEDLCNQTPIEMENRKLFSSFLGRLVQSNKPSIVPIIFQICNQTDPSCLCALINISKRIGKHTRNMYI